MNDEETEKKSRPGEGQIIVPKGPQARFDENGAKIPQQVEPETENQ